jgi:hypothetical protein
MPLCDGIIAEMLRVYGSECALCSRNLRDSQFFSHSFKTKYVIGSQLECGQHNSHELLLEREWSLMRVAMVRQVIEEHEQRIMMEDMGN